MTADQEYPAGTRGSPLGGAMTSLVIRAWLEDENPRLRVRVVEVLPGAGERPVTVTTSVDDACSRVRNWLELVQASADDDNGDGAVTQKW